MERLTVEIPCVGHSTQVFQNSLRHMKEVLFVVTLILIYKSQMNKSKEERVTVNKGTEKAGKGK